MPTAQQVLLTTMPDQMAMPPITSMPPPPISELEATAAVVTAIGTTAVGIAKLVEATKN